LTNSDTVDEMWNDEHLCRDPIQYENKKVRAYNIVTYMYVIYVKFSNNTF